MDNGAVYYSRYLQGDESAFEELVKLYQNEMILLIAQYTSDYQISEDISQDVFVKLYVNKPRYAPSASFKTWLYTIARHESLNYLRRQKHNASLSVLDSQAVVEDWLKPILREKRKIALHRALSELEPEYRRFLYLSYFEKLSACEIARIEGKTTRYVSVKLYNAKQSLKRMIEKGDKYEILRTEFE